MRARNRFRLMLIAALLGGWVASARPAAAHAILLRSVPADGATVSAGPADLLLNFNSRIDAARSRLVLTGPDGVARTLPIAAPAADQLGAHATLGAGAWVLRWQVLAIDGHITRGEVRFTVADH
jgi:methionine-rich copper-binding protein CopC